MQIESASRDPNRSPIASATTRLGVDEFAARINLLASSENDVARDAAFFDLAESLAPEDFPAAIGALHGSKFDLQARLLEIWAERDYGAAVRWFTTQAPGDRAALVKEWADTWARLNADGVMEWLAALPESERLSLKWGEGSWELARLLAERDPRMALQLSTQFPNLMGIREVVRTWAKHDLTAAEAATEALPTGSARVAALTAIAAQWIPTDAKKAFEWLHRIEDQHSQTGAMQSVLGDIDSDKAAVIADLLRSDPRATDNEWDMLCDKNPGKLIEWAQQQDDPELRAKIIGKALEFSRGAENNKTAPPPGEGSPRIDAQQMADLWLSERASVGHNVPGAANVFSCLFRENGPSAALKFLQSMPDPKASDIETAAGDIGYNSGWNSVVDLALEMRPGPLRDSWLQESAMHLTEQANLTAVQSLIDRLAPGPEREGIIQATAKSMLKSDVAGAVGLIRQMPDGESNLHSMLTDWMNADRREAKRWIRSTNLLTDDAKAHLLDPPEKLNPP